MTMRLWQPRGADEIEVFTWLLVDKESPEWFKEQTKQNYIVGFGSVERLKWMMLRFGLVCQELQRESLPKIA